MNSNNIKHKNCLISAVGKNSLHKLWAKGTCNFDIHLIVYDDSIDMFRNDADFICIIKGYKLKVIYRYLEANPHFLDVYDYFFFPDDDIKMDAVTINALFDTMRQYELRIAQPALSMSYSTWAHTLKDRYYQLRYTDFVEMMVPCFSNRAFNLLHKRCLLGDKGHNEVLMPTIFKYFNLRIADFGGHGRYIYAGCPELFYTYDPNCYEGDTCTHRCYPSYNMENMYFPNMIYHPIK